MYELTVKIHIFNLMKHYLLLLLTLTIIASAYGQDPELDGEWKLAHMNIDGVTLPAPLPEPGYQVEPKLFYDTVSEEIYTSIQSCSNIMGSQVTADPINNKIYPDPTSGWIILLGFCDPRYNEYENLYFDLIGAFNLPTTTLDYEITAQTGGVKTLVITNSEGDFAKYSNVPVPFHLFDDWEVEKLIISGTEYQVPVNGEEFNPSIYFTETDDPAIAMFTGDSGCNDFDGVVSYDVVNSELTISSYNIGGNSCVEPLNNDFELLYTSFLFNGLPATFSHSTTIDEGLVLELTKSNGDKAFYRRDYNLLSVPEIRNDQFAVYPNPAHDILNISATGLTIDNLKVYSLSGQLLFSSNENTHILNVSSLPKGLYLLEIATDKGRQIQKFIKN